ncbi:MAG: SUMF1/EgtB/PvdO family nonheme iron enzyme [Planctomycetota bacterium]
MGKGCPLSGSNGIHGNAREWCSDWFDEKYYEQSPEEDPQGPAAGSVRVWRGGGFRDSTAGLRSAYRNYYSPSNCDSSSGFRVVRALD